MERWLSDNNIPYPSPADRKDLEVLVEKNWNDYVITPFSSWDSADLSAYLQAKGKETQAEAEGTRDSLVQQVRANWYESEENAQNAWVSLKDWILDTWTESQLKAFCDKHGLPGTSLLYVEPYARINLKLTRFLTSTSASPARYRSPKGSRQLRDRCQEAW